MFQRLPSSEVAVAVPCSVLTSGHICTSHTSYTTQYQLSSLSLAALPGWRLHVGRKGGTFRGELSVCLRAGATSRARELATSA